VVSNKENSNLKCITNDLDKFKKGSLVIVDIPKEELWSSNNMIENECDNAMLKNAWKRLNYGLRKIFEHSRRCIGLNIIIDNCKTYNIDDSKKIANRVQKDGISLLRSHVDKVMLEQESQALENSDLKDEKLVQNFDKKYNDDKLLLTEGGNRST
jgi:hypothetical protein